VPGDRGAGRFDPVRRAARWKLEISFDPETFGKSAPYRVAMLGGPNNERATIVQTLLGRASIATTERSHPDALFSGRLA
jgi:hypothetical protein